MNLSALQKTALAVRCLSMDAVQAANSGHPGLPLGMADLGALLYGSVLRHDPADPNWENRDRFVLSAGHGSMLLYSLLHLSGYDVSLDDIKKFRQLGSKTPGHPEYGHTPGVETTTGPLGAGLANAVGMAIAESMLAERFNTPEFAIINHYTYVLAGDGCMMEGVASEAASLAGHLKLGKLIVFYDSNRITIEGSTSLAFTEKVRERFDAYGWQTLAGNAYDYAEMASLIKQAQAETGRPTLIELKSVIGYGSPHKAGTAEAHGAPLGTEEIKKTRQALGAPADKDFYIPDEALAFMQSRKEQLAEAHKAWSQLFGRWQKAEPALAKEWQALHEEPAALADHVSLKAYKPGDKISTRSAGGSALNAYAKVVPALIGGSADLAPSTNTWIADLDGYAPDCRSGRNLHFGVREHAMGGIINGLVLHGPFRAFGATFLVFSDYMRPAVRLAALMQLPSVFVFTHDSIYVGEDGPTHEPIEQLESLRLIPNLHVLRPADAEEAQWAWRFALLSKQNPVALCLSRQNLEVFAKPNGWRQAAEKGAYIALDCSGEPDVVVFATGSEVSLALTAAKLSDKKIRVVSVTCRSVLLNQGAAFLNRLAPSGAKRIAVEAGIGAGWGILAEQTLSIERFGLSGKAEEVAAYLGITVSNLAELF